MQRLPKSNKNSHTIDHQRDQSGPGWDQGIPENQRKYETVKTKQTETTKIILFVFEICGDFLKIRRAQRLGVHFGIMKKVG